MNADAFRHFYGYHFIGNRKIWDSCNHHGLTPPLDRKGFRVHNIVIVAPTRQPTRSSRPQIL